MTTQEVALLVGSIGLPFAYDHFSAEDAPGGPPFICFMYPSSSNFAADDGVYKHVKALAIELYTDAKDPALEARVEAALDAAGLFYDTSETWIESERMYEVVYTTEIDIDV